MELKPAYGRDLSLQWIVLIVPYGIETWTIFSVRLDRRCVNCTLWNWNLVLFMHKRNMFCVNCTLWNWNVLEYLMNKVSWSVNCTLWNWNISNTCPCTSSSHVLIVPYGIETVVSWVQICQPQKGVNCTLWNWNLF